VRQSTARQENPSPHAPRNAAAPQAPERERAGDPNGRRPRDDERRPADDFVNKISGGTRKPRRHGAPFALALLVAGCASAPKTSPYPAPYRADLSLCGGVSVSNAPATDSYRRIIGYTPFATIRGVVVARAPVDACVSSAYGPRRGGAGDIHEGLDLFTRAPAPAFSGAAGRVSYVGENAGWGLNIVIEHGAGIATRYAHLSSASVRRGDRLGAGVFIGMTGKSGNASAVHLHYEILVDGAPIDPLRAGR
jgi:murein DD-endopeptidase MepM/ murein hydrolase activator NlpD